MIDSNAGQSSTDSVSFIEHHIPRGEHNIYAREYLGDGSTFVLLHGFPDNLHIYDSLAPLLSAAGRRVVTFDFLGFGASDKPNAFPYSFEQQEGDLSTVVDALKIEKIVPVAHDASGPAAINFALSNPKRISSLALLNCIYTDAPTLRLPELIEICSNPNLKALVQAFMTDSSKLQWLLTFQRLQFQVNLQAELKERYEHILGPIIDKNFTSKPSAGPAFMHMTANLRANMASNRLRLPDLRDFVPPVSLIWGTGDPYLNLGVADDLASHFPHATVKPVTAGHWLQIDKPEEVASLLLSCI